MRLSYMVTKLKAKKDSWKKLQKKLNLKVIKTNSYHLYLGGVIRPGEALETHCYHVYGGQQQQERQRLKKQQKSHKVLRDNLVSPQKA